MIFKRMRGWLERMLGVVWNAAERYLKRWVKPDSDSLLVGSLAAMARSKRELVAENAFLRQQVIVLKRQTAHPKLRRRDRILLVVLASRVRGWKDALLLVKPDTVLKWHRAGFRLFWRHKSRGKARTPRVSAESIALIKAMAVNKRLWGAKRIRGELLKLGIKVNKRTVRRYMTQARRGLPPHHKGQTWATILANHASDIWACDFLQSAIRSGLSNCSIERRVINNEPAVPSAVP